MISIVCTRTEIWLSFLVEARLTAVVAHGRQASSTSARWQPCHFPLSCYVFAHADIARRRRGWSARLVDTHTHTRTHRMHAYIHMSSAALLQFHWAGWVGSEECVCRCKSYEGSRLEECPCVNLFSEFITNAKVVLILKYCNEAVLLLICLVSC